MFAMQLPGLSTVDKLRERRKTKIEITKQIFKMIEQSDALIVSIQGMIKPTM